MSVLTKYQNAALRYDKHISLTANAGSGKTTVLSKRFVEILLKENINLNNIVAITFTEKAASELYSKIAKELDERIISANGITKIKLETLRRNLVSAKISTIHSFCIEILKDYAPVAGIDANFSPVDKRTSDEILQQSMDEIIVKNLKEDNTEIKNLIRLFGNKTLLANKIKLLFGKRKTTEKLIENYYSKSEIEIAEWLKNNFENKFTLVFETLINELIPEVIELNNIAGGDKTTEIFIEVNRLINELNSKENLIDRFILLKEIANQILTNSGTVKKQKYISKKLYEENIFLVENINTKFEDIIKIEIPDNYIELNDDLAKFSKTITDFYKQVEERYKFKKQQKSFLDFEDLLLITYKLLQNEEVADLLSKKYKYVMVDEYQDTNEIQYQIFMPILQFLASGNLFVVGDDKQSIYMFREAEVKVFNDTKKQIEDIEGSSSLLQLPHSFRLAPNIALFTNKLFSRLFENPNPSFNEVEYNELVCAYPKDNKGKIEFIISSDEDEASEAQLISKKIIKLVSEEQNKINFNDITILCRVRKNFTELEKEFNKYQIPFSIVGGKGFYQQQLVLDVYNYLSFVINPQNDLAFVSILRAPYYGISDVDLTEISFEKGKSFFEKFKKYVSTKNKFNHYLSMLESHIKLSSKTEISELLRTIHNETGYWSYIANKSNGKQEIANLEKLIQHAIKINEQGFNTLYDFTNYLQDAINNTEDEGHAELDDTENSVKIMTIHQSKGLEFKVVILYKTNQDKINESLKSKDITIDKEFGILAKLPIRNNYFEDFQQAPIVGLYNYFQNKKSNAELKRLLYVAITRAEEHLIISMRYKGDKLIKNSFAEMIINAMNINLSDETQLLSGPLEFMKFQENNYVTTIENLETEIEISHNVELAELPIDIAKRNQSSIYKFMLEKIQSKEKNEIISASKISLFLQCPRKYQLTYEFGYGELTKLFKDADEYEFNSKEEEENVPGNILGKIVHSILEKGTEHNLLKNEIDFSIEMEDELISYNKVSKNKLRNEIIDLIEGFYNSKSFKKISQLKNYQNEIEIYKRENDYYLYGIIDKLIIENDKIIITDYKTDKISKKNIKEKSETYLNQLMFYAYILSSKFPQINNYQLSLIFIRDDTFSVSKSVNKNEVIEFGYVINDSVNKIRNKQFEEVKPGCKNMEFYLLEECQF